MIGISLLTLNVASAGGTLTYTEELPRALARVGTLEYRALVPRTVPEAGDGLPTLVVRRFPAARARPGRLLGLTVAAAAPGYFRRELRLQELEAIHFPIGVMLPTVHAPPAATTIHDLQHEALPMFFSRSQLAYRRRVYGATLRHSRIVIAISNHVRDSLVERAGVAPERIRVIPHGVDHSRFRPGTEPRGDFLLYPANRWPHKNHDRLLEAFRLVRRERPSLRLVLTGGSSGRPPEQGVETLGRVPIEELAELYRTAAAVVFPTLYEGFGMPALEAMACGCPLAVSRVGPLPELCGDAAVYFDPTLVEDIARGIDDVLSHPPAGGPERAASYSWDECARLHDDVYRELAGPSAGIPYEPR